MINGMGTIEEFAGILIMAGLTALALAAFLIALF
jgi:hypothetical protein